MEITDTHDRIYRFHGIELWHEVLPGHYDGSVTVYYVGNNRYRFVHYKNYTDVSGKMKWKEIQRMYPEQVAKHGDPVIIELD